MSQSSGDEAPVYLSIKVTTPLIPVWIWVSYNGGNVFAVDMFISALPKIKILMLKL